MAKGTIIFIFLLSLLATLLAGINIGKKLSSQPPTGKQTTINLTPTIIPSLKPSPSSSTSALPNGRTLYTNNACGYEVSYPSTWIKSEYDPKSVAFAVSQASASAKIAVICAAEVPRPPLLPEKIVDYKLGTVSAKIYHDTSPKDGSPLDELIAKMPDKNLDIYIAGFGPAFTAILSSFKFL